jgi:hypothetical protein
MNICIIGGGPTGLRIADELSALGYNIEIYEKENKLGGCWKVEWEKEYYKEHSPRVITTGYKRVIDFLKSYKIKTKEIFGSTRYTSYMFFDYISRNLSSTDLISLTYSIYFVNKKDKRTLEEWMNDKKISDRGRLALRKLSLSIGTNEKEILAYCLFRALYSGIGGNLIQLVENDKWLKTWEENIKKRKNVKIFKNSIVTKLEAKNNQIVRAKINGKKIKADIFICAIPLYALKNLLEKCDKSVKDNWEDFKHFKDYCLKSSYSGIGIQLHFKSQINIPETWEANNFNDWSIEIIDISKYSDIVSKDKSIEKVLSCVIVDTNAKSKFLNKSPNEIPDINIIINETLRQISESFGIHLLPDNVTVSNGIKYFPDKQYWDMEHSAFNPTAKGELPLKGTLDNLYSVGPHNIYEIATLENAFISADNFINEFIKNNKTGDVPFCDIRARFFHTSASNDNINEIIKDNKIENDSSFDIRTILFPTGI